MSLTLAAIIVFAVNAVVMLVVTRRRRNSPIPDIIDVRDRQNIVDFACWSIFIVCVVAICVDTWYRLRYGI